MAIWGSPWGFPFPWGGVDPGDEWACALSDSRVLVQHPDNTGERIFRDWICAFSEQAGDYLDVCQDVKNALNLDTAVGVQLDLIGSLVGLPRSGFTDLRYRTLLGIQIKLLIGARPENPNWVGTVENIVSICREFIGVAVIPPVVLQNTPPYAYMLSIPGGLSIDDILLLVRFLCKATWAAVLGQIIFDLDSTVYCYVITADTPFAGIYCYTLAADTPGAALYDHTVMIGNGAC